LLPFLVLNVFPYPNLCYLPQFSPNLFYLPHFLKPFPGLPRPSCIEQSQTDGGVAAPGARTTMVVLLPTVPLTPPCLYPPRLMPQHPGRLWTGGLPGGEHGRGTGLGVLPFSTKGRLPSVKSAPPDHRIMNGKHHHRLRTHHSLRPNFRTINPHFHSLDHYSTLPRE